MGVSTMSPWNVTCPQLPPSSASAQPPAYWHQVAPISLPAPSLLPWWHSASDRALLSSLASPASLTIPAVKSYLFPERQLRAGMCKAGRSWAWRRALQQWSAAGLPGTMGMTMEIPAVLVRITWA